MLTVDEGICFAMLFIPFILVSLIVQTVHLSITVFKKTREFKK
jgi:hypothetical protein